MNITPLEKGIKEYIEKYKASLNPNEFDLTDEINNKLKAIYSRDKEIHRLVKELHNNPKDNFHIDEESGEIFLFGKPAGITIKRKEANIPIKVAGRSEGWPRAYKGSLAELKTQLEENTINNYEDMHRIYNIFKELPKLNTFKPKGVLTTRNQLIVHAGKKSGITFDSFSVDTVVGPKIKGFRKGNQRDILPNAGYYYKDSEQFIGDLDKTLVEANS